MRSRAGGRHAAPAAAVAGAAAAIDSLMAATLYAAWRSVWMRLRGYAGFPLL